MTVPPTRASTCFGSKLRLLMVMAMVSAAKQTSVAASTDTKKPIQVNALHE
jgi:lipopolysaccharide export system protein LptA